MATNSPIPEPVTPETIIAAADAEIVESDALAAALEAAARDGDDTVTPDKLDAARKRSEWARFRRDAANKKAAARAEELARSAYADLMTNVLPAAAADPSADIEALLAQARPFVEQALDMLGDRNRAVWQVAAYTADGRNYRDPADGLMAEAHEVLPGASWFAHKGQRHGFLSGSDVFKQLLKPLAQRAEVASGGKDTEWLRSI